MKFLKPETMYALRETIRGVTPGMAFKFLVLLGLIVWAFWPEETAVVNPPPNQRVVVEKPEPLPPAAVETQKDLREKMTAAQSNFYWESFTWMMAHGPELQPKSFNGKIIFMRYLKDKPFEAENGLHCLPYSENLIISGAFNIRRGMACRLPKGGWCRQPEGEGAQCRMQEENGIFTLSPDTSVTLHNLKTGWDSNLRDLGF